jgi:acyl carrier protein
VISAEDVKVYVLNYLSRGLPANDLDGLKNDDGFDFLGTGTIDSLGVITMIAAMEAHFKISVDFERIDPEEFTVLGGFCRYVAEHAVANGG